MTVKTISTEAAAVTSPALSMASPPELSSASSSVSGGESPVFSTHQSMKQMAEGENYQKTISFAEINKREQNFSKKRDFATFKDSDTSSFTTVRDDDGFMSDSGKKSARRSMTDEEIDGDDEDPKIKRKAQNRAAQRAFRERKERYVKELEKKVRYVQDSHVYATTQLFHENQFLRSIIYRLELENNTLKGDPQVFSGPNSDLSVLPDKKMPGQSWLATIGPPVPLPVVNSFPPTPLAPLQIRPAPPVAENKPKKIISVVPEKPTKKKKKLPKVGPDANTEKQIYAKHSKENDNVTISDTTAVPCSKSITISNTTTETNIKTETSNQQFTFSITTPATLQATSDSELLRKKEPVQAVPLYPDHSHPANCSLAKNEQKQQQDDHTSNGTSSTPMLSPMVNYSSSIASSCCSNSVRGEEEEDRDISLAKSSDSTCTKSNQHEFDDLLLFDDDDNDTKGFQGIFKSFVDAGGDLDFSTDWNTTTEWNMDTLFDSF